MGKRTVPAEVQKAFDAALARGLPERTCLIAASAASGFREGLAEEEWRQALMSRFTYDEWLAELVKAIKRDESELRRFGLWPARWKAAPALTDA